MRTTLKPLRLPVCAARELGYAPSARRFLAVGCATDIARAIAPVGRRTFRAANVDAAPEHRAITLEGTTLLFLEDRTTGHMLSHYFHLLEHLVAAWPVVAERRGDVRRIVLATDGRALRRWRGPNAINEKLLAALFPEAEVLCWPEFQALGGKLGARLRDRLSGRARPLYVMDEAVVVDRALTLTEPTCQHLNKMLALYRDAFSSAIWQGLSDAVVDGMKVERRPSAELRVTHVTRTPPRCLSEAAARRLHAAIESVPGVSLRAVDFATLPYEAQIATAANTDVLVGVHGNGLSHGLFLPPRAALVELFPRSGHALDYRLFAELRGLCYLGLHPEHGVIDREAATRIGGYGPLREGIDDLDPEPIVALLKGCLERAQDRPRAADRPS